MYNIITTFYTNKINLRMETLISLLDYISADPTEITEDLMSIDRDIDVDKFSSLLMTYQDPLDQSIIEDIVINSKYIRFDQLYQNLIKSATSIIETEFNVFIDIDNLYHSETWCLALIWKEIKPKVKKIFTKPEDITSDLPLLLVDDCMYTGIHMADLMKMIDLNNKFSIVEPLKIIICVGYARQMIDFIFEQRLAGKLSLTKIPYLNQDRIQLASLYKGETICHYVPEPVQTKDRLGKIPLLDPNMDAYMRDKFNYSAMAVPIYFDHKIANNFGSFPFIYEKIIKNPVSRKGIDKLANRISSIFELY